MKIYTIIDRTPFVFLTTGYATLNLGSYIKAEVKGIEYTDLKANNVGVYEDADILIFEIGNPQHSGWSASRLREHFPNAKLVTFCSDTIYYVANKLAPQLEPGLIDLHLELMPQSIDWLREKGAQLVERWVWTCSDKLCELAREYWQKCQLKTDFDFIGVYHPLSLANQDSWRYKAVEYLRAKGYSFTQGGGTGHSDDDLYRLFDHYTRSVCTLGTSSHNLSYLTELGCCKGFRDVLGPLLGSPLIYDDHPNILSSFTCKLPTYKYHDFDSIVNTYDELRSDAQYYDDVLSDQVRWTLDNTIEKQLVRLFLKHGYISKEDLL